MASGYMDVCLAYGFETMSHVATWKGNEFIVLAPDQAGHLRIVRWRRRNHHPGVHSFGAGWAREKPIGMPASTTL